MRNEAILRGSRAVLPNELGWRWVKLWNEAKRLLHYNWNREEIRCINSWNEPIYLFVRESRI